MNVRKASGGRVFHLLLREIARFPRMLGERPADGIDIDDPRIQWIFEDAGRLANRLGYCSTYDRIMEQLGAPGRERTFTIKMAVGDGFEVTAKVTARSKRLAEAKLRGELTGDLQVKAITA